MKYFEILKRAGDVLKKKSIPTYSLDSELILSKILKIDRKDLLFNLQSSLDHYQIKKFKNLIKKREKKLPVAYILNSKYFWKSKFYVNNSVLIPRPATELMVEKVLERTYKNRAIRLLDIGTGSGCILISILLERPKSLGIGIDISKSAIKVANFNAKMQQLENRIKFINSDIDNFLSNKYDIIVSNPPYINKFSLKNLQEDVKYFEPKIALDGGLNGTSMIEKVIKKSSDLLKNKGVLVLEIDDKTLNKTKELLKKHSFYINNISKDLMQLNRCILSTKY